VSVLLGTFAFALAGGIVPVLNVEAYLVSLSALSPGAPVWPVALAAALGQMTAKSLLYFAGRGVVRLPLCRMAQRIEAASARLAASPHGSLAVVTASAVTGVPPFYATSVAAGVLRVRFTSFLAVGLAGRLLRFAGSSSCRGCCDRYRGPRSFSCAGAKAGSAPRAAR
jgi:membrane protein YqaA with SNARE-associated domain